MQDTLTTRYADSEEQTDDYNERTHRSGWGDAASHGGICRTPSCHSRDSVRPATADGDEEPLILCAHCRRMWGVFA